MICLKKTHDASCPVGLDYKLMEQLYTNSWVFQEFIPNVLNTTGGSGAGNPLADLVYSMSMARVLHTLRSYLSLGDLNFCIKMGGVQHDIVETSSVDDVAITIIAHASDLVWKTGQVVSCAYTVFKLYGTLNFKPNN